MISGLKTKEVIIGENKYTIVLFGARKALKIQIKLAKLLGSVLPSLIALENNPKGAAKKTSENDLEKILAQALQEALVMDDEKEKEIFDLAIDLLSSTHVNGLSLEDEKNFNTFFTGKTIEMWKVVAEVIKANFFSQSIT